MADQGYQVHLSPACLGPGEMLVITVTCPGAHPRRVVAYPVQMLDWRLELAPAPPGWRGERRLPAWVAPGPYQWQIEADGELVGTTVMEVVWPPQALARAAAWQQQRGALARQEAARWDAHWAAAAVPTFPLVGVWFDGGFYARYGNPQGPASAAAPYARSGDLDEVRYLHQELGCNLMVLYGVGEEAQRYGAEHLDLLAGPGGQYRFLDEPDAQARPMPEVDAWVQATLDQGLTPIVNFCGHSEADYWDGYVQEYLQRCRLPVVSVDCYPIRCDLPDLPYFHRRVRQVGEWARAAGSRYLVILQGFACLGKWAMPSPEQLVEMARGCQAAGAEGLLFFLWTSGWKGPHDEYLIGLDAMPPAYHRLLRALRGPAPAP